MVNGVIVFRDFPTENSIEGNQLIDLGKSTLIVKSVYDISRWSIELSLKWVYGGTPGIVSFSLRIHDLLSHFERYPITQ